MNYTFNGKNIRIPDDTIEKMVNLLDITREEAREQIMPYLDAVNKRSKELAKKYNQKPKLVTFASYVR